VIGARAVPGSQRVPICGRLCRCRGIRRRKPYGKRTCETREVWEPARSNSPTPCKRHSTEFAADSISCRQRLAPCMGWLRQ
jgi:hypothetical protein